MLPWIAGVSGVGEKVGSTGNELLADIQHIFESKKLDKISTAYLIEGELKYLGVDFGVSDVGRILESYDVADGLHSFFESAYDGEARDSEGPAMLAVDEIDDLFDRG